MLSYFLLWDKFNVYRVREKKSSIRYFIVVVIVLTQFKIPYNSALGLY